MSSWKTTAAGIGAILVAVGALLKAFFDGDPTTVPDFAVAGAAALSGIGLIFGRDNDVSSEATGAR